MKFPLMDTDAGLSPSGMGGSPTTDTVEPGSNVGGPAPESVPGTVGQDSVQDGLPESIPYGRFSEVVAERNQLQQQTAFLMQQYQTMLQAQVAQQQSQMAPQSEAYDPYEELAKFNEDPRAYLRGLRDEVKQETIQELQRQQQAEAQHRRAMEGAIGKYPELNTEQGKYWVYQNAMSIAHQIKHNPAYAHVTLDQLMEFSAQEISAFRNGGRTDGLREAQTRNQQKAGAYVEGASNIVPSQAGGLQAQYEKAKAAGDATAMIRLKLQMMQERQNQ